MNLTLMIFTLIVLLSIVMPKSKIILFISIVMLIILASNNNLIADRFVYEAMYNNINSYADIDIGFQYLILLSRRLGISFPLFVMLIFAVGFYLNFRIVLKMTSYPGWVLAMYLVFPFFNDVAQLRSFLGMSLLINGVYYLIFSKEQKTYKVFIFILLATSIHYTYSFFFLLLLFDKKIFNNTFGKKKSQKALAIVVSLSLLLLITVPLLIKITQSIFPLIGNRIIHYFSISTSFETRILLVFIFSFTFYIVTYWLNISKNRLSSDENSIDSSYYVMNLLLLLVFPFVFFSIEFLRIYRALFIFNYILFSNNISRIITLKKMYIKDLIGTLVVILYLCLLYIYFDLVLINESILLPFFNNNTIFN